MARMLPPYIDSSCKSSGEKRLFEIFKNSPFTRDWIVLHSLNISQHRVRLYGEIDFLILIPRGGIFVLEVKGGDVKCIEGVWHFTDRFNSTNKSKVGPFNQAREAMFSLHSALEKKFGKGHKYTKIQLGFLCAFPHIHFDKQSIEYEGWQILDKDSINNGIEFFFKNLVSNFSIKHKTQKWFHESESLPDKNVLEELSDFFRGDFEIARTDKDSLTEFNIEVKKYTEEQFRILDSIEQNKRCLIQGSAGTGKTMIAIESAIRGAAQGQNVFLTCYNRLLGDWIKRQVSEWKDRIVVSSLHSFMFEKSRGFDYDKDQINKQDFYTKYLPLLIKEFYQKGLFMQFDKLIIDEGQDLLRKEYLELFNSMIVGGLSDGNWEIFGDFERQAIYAQLSKSDMFDLLDANCQFAKFLLKINCRNTRQIGEEISLISGFDKPPFLFEHLEGVPVEYLFYSDKKHQNNLLTQKLREFSEKKIPFNELILISPKKFIYSCAISNSDFIVKEIRDIEDISTKENFIRFTTIQSFKGMESNYIFITDIEDLNSEFIKSLLYVGMSRAKYRLVLFLSDKTRNEFIELLKLKIK